MSLHSYYQGQIGACQQEIRRLQRKLNNLAVLRVGLFAWFAWSVDVLIRQFSAGWLFLSLLGAALFIMAVNIYLRWKDQRRLQEKLRFVAENELAQLGGAENRFPDGASWLDDTNYLNDLDIFGPRSFFHSINRTTTERGATVLAERLRQPFLAARIIEQQQKAIQAMAPQTAICQLLTATGLLSRETALRWGDPGKQDGLDRQGLAGWLDTPPRLSNRMWLPFVIAALAIFNLYGLYLFFDDGSFTLVIAGIIVSRLLIGIFSPYINAQHRLISHKHDLLDQYAGILAVFNQADAKDSGVLQDLQRTTGKAHGAIRRLSRLSSWFDQRLNLLVNVVLNTFFFYDLLCMMALERWKTANRRDFPGWIDAVGELEALNALATFAFNNPDYRYPVMADATPPASGITPSTVAGTALTGAGTTLPAPPAPSGLFIEATSLAHPMIPASRRVANDLSIGRDQRLILITGSNMSGKTTFLRTVGVNLLMAECGLPVCAATFTFTPMHLLTSLRITDSLQEQTSYFMAELNKLQMIIRRLGTGEPALVLIDEILRGTNSEDKTYGSEQFIRRLLQQPCLSFFATHDLTLGKLEQEMPEAISNYCFESVIEGDELHFDYRLRRGVARNRNASFLMRRMDII